MKCHYCGLTIPKRGDNRLNGGNYGHDQSKWHVGCMTKLVKAHLNKLKAESNEELWRLHYLKNIDDDTYHELTADYFNHLGYLYEKK